MRVSGNSFAFFFSGIYRACSYWNVSWEAVLETRASSGHDRAWPSNFVHFSRPVPCLEGPAPSGPFVTSGSALGGTRFVASVTSRFVFSPTPERDRPFSVCGHDRAWPSNFGGTCFVTSGFVIWKASLEGAAGALRSFASSDDRLKRRTLSRPVSVAEETLRPQHSVALQFPNNLICFPLIDEKTGQDARQRVCESRRKNERTEVQTLF